MSLILPRRSLLAGLGSLLLAPAVVKADSLMKVGNIDHILYPIRGLVAYNITTDTVHLRIDRANFPLSIPKSGIIGTIEPKELLRRFPKILAAMEAELKTKTYRHQMNAQIAVPASYEELKVNWIDKGGPYSDYEIK